MIKKTRKIIKYNHTIVQKIFDNKKSFRREQARLPIEEKIKILVELQKIVLKTKHSDPSKGNMRVWQI